MKTKKKCWKTKSKWPTNKKLIFQFRQFSIFFTKISWIGPLVNWLMQRALVWLNPYGREDVWNKLKNSLKTQKMHFLPVFELMSNSLTTILHQCPSHQSILGTQGTIHEIFMIQYWELAELENELFFSRTFCLKTCPSLLVSKDFSKFWWLPWFLAPNSTCLKIFNTV